jgi:hypothetical protein
MLILKKCCEHGLYLLSYDEIETCVIKLGIKTGSWHNKSKIISQKHAAISR